MTMANGMADADFEKRVELLSGDLVEVVRTGLAAISRGPQGM